MMSACQDFRHRRRIRTTTESTTPNRHVRQRSRRGLVQAAQFLAGWAYGVAQLPELLSANHGECVTTSPGPTPDVPTTVQVLLFDLGGVLVEFSGVRDVAPLLRFGTTGRHPRRWNTCPQPKRSALAGWARKSCSVVVETGESIWRPSSFAGVSLMSRRLMPGAAQLLAALRPRFRLAA